MTSKVFSHKWNLLLSACERALIDDDERCRRDKNKSQKTGESFKKGEKEGERSDYKLHDYCNQRDYI